MIDAAIDHEPNGILGTCASRFPRYVERLMVDELDTCVLEDVGVDPRVHEKGVPPIVDDGRRRENLVAVLRAHCEEGQCCENYSLCECFSVVMIFLETPDESLHVYIADTEGRMRRD